MQTQQLVRNWFQKWESGDFMNLPVADHFKHTSPFGTINGKKEYLKIIEANKDKFLGYKFDILDELFENHKACVRYVANQGDFRLEVSKWYVIKDELIDEIFAYYHIGEIREDRKLKTPA